MQFKELHIKSGVQGLNEIELNDLGRIVALAGKNGSGKTRILNLLKDYTQKLPLNVIEKEIDFNQPVRGLRTYLATKTIGDETLEAATKRYLKDSIKKIDYQKKPTSELLFFKKVPVKEGDKKAILQSKLLKLITAKEIESIEPTLTAKEVIEGLSQIANPVLKEEFQVTKKRKKEDETVYYKLFEKFREYVNTFLNTDIEVIDQDTEAGADFNGAVEFSKFPFDYKILSPGQEILLTYAFYFALFEVRTNINAGEYIYILDEPELHIHPDIQISLIRALKKIIKNKGQLWIATHSVHILSELNYDEIYLVKEGTVYPPNRTRPAEAISELMGIRDNTDKVNEFLVNTTKWAETNFAIQCLEDPQVIAQASSKDPEVGLVTSNLGISSLKILDFGAGKCRLGLALSDQKGKNLISISQYDVFEPNVGESMDVFNTLPFKGNFFSELNKISKNTYDLVVLIGVLHEIDPKVMVESLNAAIASLKQPGRILIVEDLLFPKGEMPHEKGYFVFNTSELNILFNQKPGSGKNLKSTFPGYENRIEGSLFKNDGSLIVTKESLHGAVNLLKNRTLESVLSIRKSINNVADGRKYAFYCQQYINCKLFTQEIKKQYIILNKANDKAITILNKEDEMVYLAKTNHQNDQVWEFEWQRLNLFSIVSKHSNKCLEVANASDENSTPILQNIFTGSPNQLWEIITNSDGSYMFRASFTGKYIEQDAKSLKKESGIIIQHEFNGEIHQKWLLKEVNKVQDLISQLAHEKVALS